MNKVTDPDQKKDEKLLTLMQKYEKNLLRLCCVYLRDASLAEDAVQECFIKAYKAMDSFRGQSSEKTWLYKIATNVCRDIRRTAWHRYVDKSVDFDKLPIPTEPVRPESIALMTEVMRLPRKYMEAVWLHYYEDMSMSEIGQLSGVSAAAISYRLDKAKKLLYDKLGGDE